MLWEFPICILRELGFPLTFFTNQRPNTVFWIHAIVHSIWDATIFLIGSILIKINNSEPVYSDFRIKDILILLIWGQVQSFIVELTSILSGAWEYVAYWWNPALITINGRNLRVLPQIIWLVAVPIFYYLIVTYNQYRMKEIKDD